MNYNEQIYPEALRPYVQFHTLNEFLIHYQRYRPKKLYRIWSGLVTGVNLHTRTSTWSDLGVLKIDKISWRRDRHFTKDCSESLRLYKPKTCVEYINIGYLVGPCPRADETRNHNRAIRATFTTLSRAEQFRHECRAYLQKVSDHKDIPYEL